MSGGSVSDEHDLADHQLLIGVVDAGEPLGIERHRGTVGAPSGDTADEVWSECRAHPGGGQVGGRAVLEQAELAA